MPCCPPSCAIPSCPQPCCPPCSPCPPSCAIPTCPKPCCSPCCSPCCPPCPPCGYPTGGLGKLSCCPSSCSSPPCCGKSTSARSLGIAPGASVSCINQLPPSEVTIKPAPAVVTIPGPILSATCEPVRVGGYTACGGPAPCGRICPC